MSLYGALFSGVSGLKAQSNKIGVISDNISNVNTVGYKGGTGVFQSLVTTAASATAYSPGGVLGGNRQLISSQGLLQSTNSPTDIAISGSGFFVVNQASDGGGSILYTRAGSFTQDATGNFRNSSGFFLQAWPLDREGRLPGDPGNANTISSANLGSLRTVNVQNLSGVAAATTTLALGANLDASQSIFPGAGATTDVFDGVGALNGTVKGKDIIVLGGTSAIDRDDVLTITTNDGVDADFVYGGYTFSRSVSAGTGSDSATAVTDTTATLVNTPINVPIGDIDTTATSNVITVTVASTANLNNNDTVTITGLTTNVSNVPFGQINGAHTITVTSGTTFTFTQATVAAASAGSTEVGTATPNPFATTASDNTVVVHHESHGLVDGQVVTISGVSGAVNNIPAAELNSRFVITVVDDHHYSIETPTTQANLTGGGGTGTIIADMRPYAGNILDANNATQTFLGTTGVSNFTTASLSFTITTSGSITETFTYTPASPNAQLGQFNTLTNLAAAITAVDGLTARISGGKLYVGAVDASEGVTFTNGSVVGAEGPPVQYGIDWVDELGLVNITSSANPRFSSLDGLALQVNLVDGLSGTVNNGLTTDAALTINVDNPQATVTFTDDVGNTGSLLEELGLSSTGTLGPLGPSYDPADATKNMSSGAITAQFSRPGRIFDAQGTGHDINIAFIKLASNTWGVEVYAIPETDISGGNGLITSGTLVFNGDGSLLSISPELTNEIAITWSTGADASQVTFNWGTAGLTDGLTQFDSDFRVNFLNQNGAPVGELTGVAIDEEGFVTASFSNGETQRLYKIPLAVFANPDQLRSLTGNVFGQTSQSGEVNLSEAGGSGVGKIAQASLEASNVELAEQLTDMIVAQRAYQANTKTISTADSLLEELNRILQ